MRMLFKGFEKRAIAKATLGAGIGLGAGYASAKKEVEVSNLKEDALPESKNLSEFTKALLPGDIIYSGAKYKKLDLMAESDRMMALGFETIPRLGGSTNFHAMVYSGKGKVLDVSRDREDHRAKEVNLKEKVKGRNKKEYSMIAYRPIGGTPEETQAAVREARSLMGSKYPGNSALVTKSIKTLLGVPGRKDDIKASADDIVCQDVAVKAYPDKFRKRHLTVAEMQYNKNFTPVAKTGRFDYNKKERGIANTTYPILKSIRGGIQGLIAGGALDLAHK